MVDGLLFSEDFSIKEYLSWYVGFLVFVFYWCLRFLIEYVFLFYWGRLGYKDILLKINCFGLLNIFEKFVSYILNKVGFRCYK